MPRPGPRPYECVRRAWHSDRHQPIRGSLIQQIFRAVNQIHSSQTKKNKEWQLKLPVVVLKAEEIIYSKANSEAEYMDLHTLWERTNDAINTIIRREDGIETADLLHPCIEAALILGCTARRASRSQRNTNPRSYLSPTTQETSPVLPRVLEDATHGGSSNLVPLHSTNPTIIPQITPYHSTTITPFRINSTQLRLESGSINTLDTNPSMSHVFPFSLQSMPSPTNQVVPLESNPIQDFGDIYPLYSDAHHHPTHTQFVYQPLDNTNSTSALLAPSKADEKDFLQSFMTLDVVLNTSSTNMEEDLRSTAENPSQSECDLSLHLGSFSAPGASADSRFTHEVEDIGSSSSQEGSVDHTQIPWTSKEHCFFPRENANDTLESSSSKRNSKGKSVDLEGSTREHKKPVSNFVETSHLTHHPKFLPQLFFGRMNNPDK